jgi:predicted RNase H-related nuclease YkuK (DUF458 family)
MLEGVLQYNDLPTLLKQKWFCGSGYEIDFNNIIDHISKNQCDIYVGADSNPSRLPIIMAVSIAIIKQGEFARYFYIRFKPWKNQTPGLRQRLQDEVTLSCYIANEIREILPERKIIVHADINPDLKTASGKFSKQLKNYIVGYGFVAIIKPMSWAASCIADKYAE